jgi:hypothetical protein
MERGEGGGEASILALIQIYLKKTENMSFEMTIILISSFTL